MSDLDQAIAPLALGDDDEMCEWYRRPDIDELPSGSPRAGRGALEESGLCRECAYWTQDVLGAQPKSSTSHSEQRNISGGSVDSMPRTYTFRKPYSQLRGDASFCALCRAVQDSVDMTLRYETEHHSTPIPPENHVRLSPYNDDGLVFGFLVGFAEYKSRSANWTSFLEVEVRETDPLRVCDNLSSFAAIKGHETVTIRGARFRKGVPCWNMTQMLRSWLRECDSDHDDCRHRKNAVQSSTNVDTSASPSRLLEIRQVDGRLHVRLVAGKGKRTRYAALSHRWGDYGSIRTTTLNIENYRKDISFDSLPLTLQQAIQITHSTGVRHLWIDCLCIIQDDDDDWALEAPKMGTIYASAYFTIAASAFEDKGCFPIKFSEDHRIAINVHPGLELNIFPRSYTFHESVWSVHQEPLQKRGWTLQERLLSQRILYCSRFEYYWLCREQRQRACGDDRFDYFGWSGGLPPVNLPLLLHSSTRTRRAGLIKWYSLLFDYSNRQLTLQKDKLIAINGLVDIFQRWLGSRYLHGLWECDLACGLVWFPSFPDSESGSGWEDTTFQPCPTRAPSWSWASMDAPQVQWGDNLHFFADTLRRPVSELVHVKATVASDDEQRTCLSGEKLPAESWVLKISGRLSKAFYGYEKAGKQSYRSWQIKRESGPQAFEFRADDPNFDPTENIGDAESSRLYVLPIYAHRGLVITPATDDDVPLYRRVGVCDFQSPIWWRDMYGEYSEGPTAEIADGTPEHATVQTDDRVIEALGSADRTDAEAFEEDDTALYTASEVFEEGDLDAELNTEGDSGGTENSTSYVVTPEFAAELRERWENYIDEFGWLGKEGASETIFLC